MLETSVNMTMYLVYTVILFFPAAFINLVIGGSKSIRLSVEITQNEGVFRQMRKKA